MAAATKIVAAINNIQNTLRKPGSHLVPEATKLPLQQCLAELEDNLTSILLNRVQLGDGNGGLEMPDVKKALATAKKHEALFSATVRTYGGPHVWRAPARLRVLRAGSVWWVLKREVACLVLLGYTEPSVFILYM